MKVAHIVGVLMGVAGLALLAFLLRYEQWVELPAARAKIAAQLRDPAATQFRNDRFTGAGWLCGELNGRNGAGGYNGFRRYISAGRPGDYYIEGESSVGEQDLGADTARFIAVKDVEIRLMREHNDLATRVLDLTCMLHKPGASAPVARDSVG